MKKNFILAVSQNVTENYYYYSGNNEDIFFLIYLLLFVASLITKHDFEGTKLRTIVNAGTNSWKWSVKEDVLYYFKDDIILTFKEPQIKNSRVHYDVPEMQKYI